MPRAARRLPWLAVPLVALAACGGSGREARGSTPTAAPSAAPATATTAAIAPARQAAAAQDWPTYHRDLARAGFAARTPQLGRVRRAWSRGVDGKVYAEPLVAGGRVIAATENDTVYALDAASGRRLWSTHLGTPVDGGTLPCGNIDPSGITGTPAVDRGRGLVYAVAFLRPARHVLVALDLASGRERFRRDIDPPGADPRVHQQRSALAVSRGRVYVAYGGLFGDCGDYHGWVVSAPASGPGGSLQSYRVPTNREGGIWAPSGPAVDATGHLYVATGNGDSTTSFDFGNAVIRLSPTLQRDSFFAPRDSSSLNASDTDLGSVGPLLLPSGRVFAIGKSGEGFLLRATRLGGIGGAVASRGVCDAAFGGLAYAGGRIYVPCTSGLVALRLRSRSFSVAWRVSGVRPGPPIVAGGAVWAVDLDGRRLNAYSTGSGRRRFSAQIGSPAQFSTPAASGTRVFVGGGARVVAFSGA